MIIFMFISYYFKLDSLWRHTIGDFRSLKGDRVIKNIFNKRTTIDYLHYMRFEAFQYIFLVSFLMINLFITFGISYNSITLKSANAAAYDDLLSNAGWSNLPNPCKVTNVFNMLGKLIILVYLTKKLKHNHESNKRTEDIRSDSSVTPGFTPNTMARA